MAKIPFHADLPAQSRFLSALDATRMITVAAEIAGISTTTVDNARRDDPVFNAAIAATLARPLYSRTGKRYFLPHQRVAFLHALAETGCAVDAARAAGVSKTTAYKLKSRDARFAAAWSDARAEALDTALGRLIKAGVEGFVRTDTTGGVERRRVSHEPHAVLKLLERHAMRPSGRGRMIELTPEVARRARASLVRKLTNGGGLATMAEAIDYAASQTATDTAAGEAATVPAE